MPGRAAETPRLGTWVASSGPRDPAACVGSEAKTTRDLHEKPFPGTDGGEAEGLAPYCIWIPARRVKSQFGTLTGPLPNTSILEPAAVITPTGWCEELSPRTF